MSTAIHGAESLGMHMLSVVLISPHQRRRDALTAALSGPQATVTREFAEYPSLDALTGAVDRGCDVAIVDVDADVERALDLVENICAGNPLLTVMVYSGRHDTELLVRCMRAGAREFLSDPLLPSTIGEALVRVSARVLEARKQKKTAGKLLVFAGAKGGSGVTTIAGNFALALTRESGGNVVLADVAPQLGDAALTLGLSTQFSIVDAVRNEHRLDWEFVSTLLAKHASGLAVLAAADTYHPFGAAESAIGALLRVLQEQFAYVVIDAGSTVGALHERLFEVADVVYLVTQVSIPALRNAHRLISHFSLPNETRRLEIVLNRFDSRLTDLDEQGIARALVTQPPKWKVPNDYAAVRRAQNTGIALAAAENTQISRVLHEMARAACGKAAAPQAKKKFGLF